MPKAASAGPDPRISSGTAPDVPPPPTTKPVMSAFDSPPTFALQEMLISRLSKGAVSSRMVWSAPTKKTESPMAAAPLRLEAVPDTSSCHGPVKLAMANRLA
jgi:hypothetical protein